MRESLRPSRRARAAVTAAAVVGLTGTGLLMAAPSAAASPARHVVHPSNHARLLRGQAIARFSTLASHQGLARMRAGSARNIAASTNWSGLAGTGSGIQGALGEWTVPAIKASSKALYSSSWVGVDGDGNDDLIQTGTAQDTGSPRYTAWTEILPAPSVTIVTGGGSPAPVKPGDKMEAYVSEVSQGTWTIYIEDTTQKWYYQNNFSYDGPGQSAEWIEEAPTVNGEQSVPADFGTVHFSHTAVMEGGSWYSTDMNAKNEIAMINQAQTKLLAVPTAPTKESSAGQSFSDSYLTPPTRPLQLKPTAKAHAVALSWKRPASTGGCALAGYGIVTYLNGTKVKTQATKSTSATVTGLKAGGAYRFAVVAENIGAWIGPPAETAVVHPKS